MNCRDMEKLIALQAEGDLPASEAESVVRHLETCAACRALLAELALSQTALRQLRDEPLDEVAVAAWRRGVLDHIEAGVPKRRFVWVWTLAAAAAGVVLVVAVSQMPSRPIPQAPSAPSIASVMAPPPLAVVAPTPVQPQPLARVRHRARPRPQPEPDAQPLLVRFETSDPNVIIYWTIERKGG